MIKVLKNNALVLLFLAVVLSLPLGCKTNKIDKQKSKAENLVVLDSLYKLDNFRIEVDVAYPFTTGATAQVANALLRNIGENANRVDIRGEGNFVEIKNDTVKGYLPFFGERRLNGGSYGGRDLAIQFDEKVSDLKKRIDKDKEKLELEFSANHKGDDTDFYDIILNIYPNDNVEVIITPVHRTFMRYRGRLKSINDEE